MEVRTKILDKYVVTIDFSIAEKDHDVGIFRDYVDDWIITEIDGVHCKEAPIWLYKEIENSKGEEDRILQVCIDAIEF